MKEIKVIPIGEQVVIHNEIIGTVAAININAASIEYKCIWWSSNHRHVEWLHDFEVSQQPHHSKHKLKTIGFH